MKLERKILLNPGPATTTDSVKLAQVVPDICPREKEFISIMKDIRDKLVEIVHGDDEYTSVLFCGSGTINLDICLNSLLPENKKVLIINNGFYSGRAVEICDYYGLPYIELKYPHNALPNLNQIEETLNVHGDIAMVYTTHNETGTGLLNPISEIGKIAHEKSAIFVVDTTSTFAMRPIYIKEDNVDFCMASSQKGLMAMTGLSFIVGKRSIIEQSKMYPKRSYYCNLYMQYQYFEEHGEMHFTPPVQTVYATKQAIKEYFQEGEENKWNRHRRVFHALYNGMKALGFQFIIKPEWQSELVLAVKCPENPNWNFESIHDYCYKKGFTIYPGKLDSEDTFRLCALGAIDEPDINSFLLAFQEALRVNDITIPVSYHK